MHFPEKRKVSPKTKKKTIWPVFRLFCPFENFLLTFQLFLIITFPQLQMEKQTSFFFFLLLVQLGRSTENVCEHFQYGRDRAGPFLQNIVFSLFQLLPLPYFSLVVARGFFFCKSLKYFACDVYIAVILFCFLLCLPEQTQRKRNIYFWLWAKPVICTATPTQARRKLAL